jgi:hypothetical protein
MRLNDKMIGDRLKEAGLYPEVIQEIRSCIRVKNEWDEILKEEGY